MMSRCLPILLLVLGLCGCATPRQPEAGYSHPFDFSHDAFAYANELKWKYEYDSQTGQVTTHRQNPPPDYTLHCFVVARSARQFFQHASFDDQLPQATEAEYRKLVRTVISRNPRQASPDGEKVIIPGYASLREFSAEYESLLKAECGSAWQSYFQRGHWRMIFPFSRRHQKTTSEKLAASLDNNRPPIVHVARFPDLGINHAVLLFDYWESEKDIQFLAYDPNTPDIPINIFYDRTTRTFYFPRTAYFAGGKVNIYEIYSNWRY